MKKFGTPIAAAPGSASEKVGSEAVGAPAAASAWACGLALGLLGLGLRLGGRPAARGGARLGLGPVGRLGRLLLDLAALGHVRGLGRVALRVLRRGGLARLRGGGGGLGRRRRGGLRGRRRGRLRGRGGGPDLGGADDRPGDDLGERLAVGDGDAEDLAGGQLHVEDPIGRCGQHGAAEAGQEDASRRQADEQLALLHAWVQSSPAARPEGNAVPVGADEPSTASPRRAQEVLPAWDAVQRRAVSWGRAGMATWAFGPRSAGARPSLNRDPRSRRVGGSRSGSSAESHPQVEGEIRAASTPGSVRGHRIGRGAGAPGRPAWRYRPRP